MFTGIIEATGRIRRTEDLATTRRFVIEAPDFAGELSPGESIAVDGACLTAVQADAGAFAVDVIGTTLERTIAGRYAEGTAVNLERATRVGDRLDGPRRSGRNHRAGQKASPRISCQVRRDIFLRVVLQQNPALPSDRPESI